MKYISNFINWSIKESVSNDDILKTISDILLEIQDLGWCIKVWQESNGNYVIIISPKNVEDYHEWEELEEPISNHESISVIKLTIQELIEFMNNSGFENYRLTFEQSDFMQENTEDISIDEIENYDVYYDNFFRLEFSN